MGVVILRHIFISHLGSSLCRYIVLIHTAAEQSLTILLHQTLNLALRGGEQAIGLLNFELADNPAIDILSYICHAVLALEVGGHNFADFVDR